MNGMKSREDIQKEATSAASKSLRRTIVMSVGSGKTKVALEIVKDAKEIYVIIPKVGMKKIWDGEITKHGYDIKLNYVTYKSLIKLDPSLVGYLILDEVHSVTKKHVPWLRKYKGPILGLTGTPPNSYEKKNIIAYTLPICYEIYEDQVIENNIINDYEIIVHGIELSSKKNIKITSKTGVSFFTSEADSYGYWASKIDPEVVDKDLMLMMMSSMLKFPSKLHYTKKLIDTIEDKVLVFVNTKEQADQLSQNSYYSGNKKSDENLALFTQNEIKVLTCVNQLNEGHNIPDLKTGIILHSYSNDRMVRQRIGRFLRLPVNVKCTVHILCYLNTHDELWLNQALQNYDQSKIKYVTNLL